MNDAAKSKGNPFDSSDDDDILLSELQEGKITQHTKCNMC